MEPQFITIPLSEYQQLITALQDLSRLRDEVRQLREKVTDLEQTQDQAADQDLIQLRLIKELREQIQPSPGPITQNRAEILLALLAAHDGKLLEKVAREKMGLKGSSGKVIFSRLLASVNDRIGKKPFCKDRRQSIIFIK